MSDFSNTRTAHCDGVQCAVARYIPHSARRLSRLLDCEWQA